MSTEFGLSTGLEGVDELDEKKDECLFFLSTAGGGGSVPESTMVVNDEPELGRNMLRLFRRRRSAIVAGAGRCVKIMCGGKSQSCKPSNGLTMREEELLRKVPNFS